MRAHFSGLCAIFTGLFGLLGPTIAGAEPASPWVKGFHTETRLVAGKLDLGAEKSRTVAGVHILLDKGWKTYWRSPGDAGIPPNFDWSGSKNVERAEVLWPAPRRLKDPAGSSIGYESELVIPVVLEAKDPRHAMNLNLRLEFAICEKICVPAEAKMALSVPAGENMRSDGLADLISYYVRKVPHKTAPRSKRLPRLREVALKAGKPSPYLSVIAEYPPGTTDADLFVEGPADIYLPMSKPKGPMAKGLQTYRIGLADVPDPNVLRGKPLRFTLVSAKAQTETVWTID